jgi:response regulator of citrate/malate metabolism
LRRPRLDPSELIASLRLPCSATELSALHGVSRSTGAAWVAFLVASGAVEQIGVRCGVRGRPAALYAATSWGLSLVGGA